MGDVLLNGRPATAPELAAIERARQCQRDRDRELLAGVLTAEPELRHGGRPVADLLLEFSHVRRAS
jgi:hypothetical protein